MTEEPDGRYSDVTDPMRVEDAFGIEGGAAGQAQAAALLVLGRWMRGDPGGAREPGADAWPDLTDESPVAVAPARDLKRLGIPPLADELSGSRGTLYGEGALEELLGEPLVGALRQMEDPPESEWMTEAQASLWQRLLADPSGPAVAALHFVSMYHRDPLVRTAAAAASVDSLSDHHGRPRQILERGIESPHKDLAELAAVGLRRLAPESPRLRRLLRPSRQDSPPMPAHTSLMVHGTFARRKPWWRPGGDFHSYVLASIDGSLYSGGDRFDWSGGWSDAARALGTLDLMGWVADKGLQGLDLFSHSHGGNLALLTTHGGLDLGRLVMLSCPVHQRYVAAANPKRIAKAVSVRTRMDLVILADGGGQRFRERWIREVELPVWFKHSITHDPAAWVRYGIPAKI